MDGRGDTNRGIARLRLPNLTGRMDVMVDYGLEGGLDILGVSRETVRLYRQFLELLR